MKTLFALRNEGNPRKKTSRQPVRSSHTILMGLVALLLGLYAAGVLVTGPVVFAQEKGVLTVAAKIYPKPGKGEEVQALVLKMVQAVRTSEPDNIVYLPHRSAKEPTVILMYEQYRSEAAYEFHRTAPHLVEYRKQLGTLVDKPTDLEFYRSLGE